MNVLNLPIEIWVIIFKFLLLKDLFNFKFLSRRANSIYFFVGKGKGLDFLINCSKNIFNVNDYNKFQMFLTEKFIFDIKRKFSFSKYLFLRSSLEEISRELCVSNILFHLFHCPRSVFARNDCLKCSRLFLRRELKVSSEYLENLNVLSYLESDENLIQNFEFNIFWNDNFQKSLINSDTRRCLNIFVIQNSKQFLLLILEIQFRIFMNFFHLLSESFSKKEDERVLFMKMALYFVNKFSIFVIKNIKLNVLNNIFEEIEFDQFKFLKVINKKYKKELIERYNES